MGLEWAGGPLLQSPLEGIILKGDGIGGVGPEVGPMGSKGKEKVSDVVIGLRFGPARNGPSLTHLKNFGVQPIGPPALLRDNLGLVEIRSIDKGPLGKVCSSAQPEPCGEDNIEMKFLSLREKEAGRKQQVDFHISLIDSALVEEVSRYGPLSNSRGFRDSGSPSHSILFSFGRTPEREFFDHSGMIREGF